MTAKASRFWGTDPRLSDFLLWFAIAAALLLSIASSLKVCSECSVTAQYRIFGMDFGLFGILFFAVLFFLMLLRSRVEGVGWLVLALLFSALGAETRFVWIQKYDIGQWCPVCLWIAASVAVACAAALWRVFKDYCSKGVGMKSWFVTIVFLVVSVVAGFGGAVAGVKKEIEAGPDLFLGKTTSPTTVYFISDWFCPVCRKLEPAIEKMYPELARSFRIGFVDLPVHKETLNFTPYNLQFMTYEKNKYIRLRRVLTELSVKTKNPTEAEVQAAVSPLGVKLRQMNYADTLYGMQSNMTVYRGFGVNATPTVVVTNSKTNKNKVLVGDNQISEAGIRGAIAEVEKK